MINIIYGRNRGEKTKSLYRRIAGAANAGRECILIVPEQNVLEAESALADLEIRSLSLQVMSFSRLANSVFRTYGGLSYNYISNAGRELVLWRALRELSPELEYYGDGDGRDGAMLDLLLSFIGELRASAITPDQLDEASKKSGDDKEFSGRLRELSGIYELYNSILHEKYSDRTDDLAIAAKLLEGKDYFKDKYIFIDAFSGFTADELILIRRMAGSCAGITITLGCAVNESREIFSRLKDTDRALRKIASLDRVSVTQETFDTPADSEELEFISKNLFRFGTGEKLAEQKNSALILCPDIFSEAVYAASRIRRMIIEGAKYRDFTLIVRNTGSYAEIIKHTFAKYDIPVFVSSRTDIDNMPLIRFIISAFNCIIYGYRTEDVVSYIGAGFCALDPESADMLTRYASMWRIRGRRWSDPDKWRMNPKGFGKQIDGSGEEDLEKINNARDKVIPSLSAFAEIFTTAPTVRRVSASLFDLFTSLDIPAQLEELAASQRRDSQSADAEVTMQLWNSVIDVLDTLVNIAGDIRVSAEDYLFLLRQAFSRTDIGKIPPALDCVSVYPADLARKQSSDHVFILGVNEGVFPAISRESGIIGDSDREKLYKLGIELRNTKESREKDELLHFYNSVTSAVKGVYISCSRSSRPSVAFEAVRSLFEKPLTAEFSDIPEETFACSPDTALEYALTHRNDPGSAEIINNLAKKDGRYYRFTLQERIPLTEGEYSLSENVTGVIAGSELKMSQSKAETYVKCPFLYYCKYILELSPEGSAEPESNDIGTFIHHVLEVFFKEVRNRDISTITKEEINERADRIIEEYRAELTAGESDSRTNRLFERLTSHSKVIINNIVDEFLSSDFRPALYEYRIGDGSGVGSLPVDIDGTRVVMSGYIDRVDSFVKDKDVYIRIIDYKTGSKTFNLGDIEKGQNLQMLIYLYSLCGSDSSRLRRDLGIPEDGRILPAGALYHLAGEPESTMREEEPDPELAAKLVEKGIKRSGILTRDREILSHMERGLEGRFIPAVLKKDGELDERKCTFADSETFDKVRDQVTKKLTEIASSIKSGRIDASPTKDNKKDLPCSYCEMRPVCRRKTEQ